MKIAQFIELIDNPSQVAEPHISSIEKILNDYPFFQSAHLLYAKALKNSKHINYHNALKRTAVIARNRAVLYRLINQAIPQTIIRVEEIKEEVIAPKIEIKDSEIIAEENTLQPINYVYTIVKSEKEIVSKEELSGVKQEVEADIEVKQPETLNEIVLNPIVEAYIETEILKINEKEPEISIEEPQSFSQWLKQLPNINKQATVTEKKEAVKKPSSQKIKTEKQEFLDKLLSEELRISKPQADKNFYAATQKTRSSVLEDENLVTETLAKIYVLQGNHGKAIRSYEILSLKFPEKSAYFASLIKEIKNNVK